MRYQGADVHSQPTPQVLLLLPLVVAGCVLLTHTYNTDACMLQACLRTQALLLHAWVLSAWVLPVVL